MYHVSVIETGGMGIYIYTVYVDGVKYDEMYVHTGRPLAWSEQNDIAAGYAEALGRYE